MSAPAEHAFTTYGLVELFQVLGASQEKGKDFAHDIRRRVHLYFTLINLLLVAAAVGLFLWHLNWSRPLAVEPDGERQRHQAGGGDQRAAPGAGAGDR